MPAFGYLFPRPFTLSFFQLSWQQLSSFQLFLGSQHLHHLKCSDKTHILAPQKAFTESWEWLSQPARNLPSLYPGMRSALFAWSETLWFVILLPLFSSLKYYLVHISSLYLHCKLFLWGRAHCTHFLLARNLLFQARSPSWFYRTFAVSPHSTLPKAIFLFPQQIVRCGE